MKCTLPKPLSVNHIWKIASKPFPRMYMTPRGKQWFEEAGWLWNQARGYQHDTITGEVELAIDLYYCRPIDLDNVCKCGIDSLTKSGVIADDKQVASIVLHRYKVPHIKDEKLEIEVFEL